MHQCNLLARCCEGLKAKPDRARRIVHSMHRRESSASRPVSGLKIISLNPTHFQSGRLVRAMNIPGMALGGPTANLCEPDPMEGERAQTGSELDPWSRGSDPNGRPERKECSFASPTPWRADELKLEANSTHGVEGATPTCLLYTSPSPRDLSTSRMPSSA